MRRRQEKIRLCTMACWLACLFFVRAEQQKEEKWSSNLHNKINGLLAKAMLHFDWEKLVNILQKIYLFGKSLLSKSIYI